MDKKNLINSIKELLADHKNWFSDKYTLIHKSGLVIWINGFPKNIFNIRILKPNLLKFNTTEKISLFIPIRQCLKGIEENKRQKMITFLKNKNNDNSN